MGIERGTVRSPRVTLLRSVPSWVLVGRVVHWWLLLLGVDVHALGNLLVLNTLRELILLRGNGASGHWHAEGGLTGLVRDWLTLVVVVSRGDGGGGFSAAVGIVQLVSWNTVVRGKDVLLREVGRRWR